MTTSSEDLLLAISAILDTGKSRVHQAAEIAELIRSLGPYRWTGIYDVDMGSGLVSNIAWSGPSGPEFPTFAISKGLTSRAISTRATVNVGNVAQDADYLTALPTTQSEIIVPIVSGDRVVGTLDVESEMPNAFDSDTQNQIERCAFFIAKLWDKKGMRSSVRAEQRRNPWKGLLAGALGGVVGSFAMGQFHACVLPRAEPSSRQNKDDSTVLAGSAISQALFHHQLTEHEKKLVGPAVHYAFGASTAAVYAMLVECKPVISAGWGIPLGIVVWMGAHVIAVPALGLSKPITRSTPPAEAAEFGAHLVYGAVAEVVRRLVRIYVLP